MKCPDCQGLKLIYIAATPEFPRYELICPTCEGSGELPDPLLQNFCAACGEPIPMGETWCNVHKAAEELQ